MYCTVDSVFGGRTPRSRNVTVVLCYVVPLARSTRYSDRKDKDKDGITAVTFEALQNTLFT